MLVSFSSFKVQLKSIGLCDRLWLEKQIDFDLLELITHRDESE